MGPLLFTMYINNLPSHVNKNTSKNCLYADDTAIFVRSQNVNEINRILNDELAKVSDWLNNNKLTLNVKKNKVMLFGSKIKLSRNNDILDVKIKNSCVEQVNSFNTLVTKVLLLPLVPKGGSMEPPEKTTFPPEFCNENAPYMYGL